MRPQTPLSGDILLSATHQYYLPALADLSTTPTPLQKHFAHHLDPSLSKSRISHFFALETSSTCTLPSPPWTSPSRSSYDPPSPEYANPYRDYFSDDDSEKHDGQGEACTEQYRIGRFAPPRFSERLRALVKNRPRPLNVYVGPVTEKQRILVVREEAPVAVESAQWPPTPNTGFMAWVETWDKRIVLAIAVMFMMGFLTAGSWILAGMWAV